MSELRTMKYVKFDLQAQMRVLSATLESLPLALEALMKEQTLKSVQIRIVLDPKLSRMKTEISELAQNQDRVNTTLSTRFTQIDDDLAWLGHQVTSQRLTPSTVPPPVSPRPLFDVVPSESRDRPHPQAPSNPIQPRPNRPQLPKIEEYPTYDSSFEQTTWTSSIASIE